MVDDSITILGGSGIYILKGTQMTCLLAVCKFANTVSGFMQWALLTVETWCNEVGLSVNSDKTEPVAFTRKRKLPGLFELHFFGVTLSPSKPLKFQEVILDSGLNWREHVVEMKKAHNVL